MSNNTGNRGYTYPTLGDDNDVPFFMQQLAEQVDADVALLNNPSPVAVTFNAGWGDLGVYQGGIATRASGGLIGLAGMVWRTGTTIATTTAEQTIGTLPVGYRPSKEVWQIATGQYQTGGFDACRIRVLPDGTIRFAWQTSRPWTTSAAWVNITGITYVAAA